jgi:Ni,Fe-hydrogenase maturation factor
VTKKFCCAALVAYCFPIRTMCRIIAPFISPAIVIMAGGTEIEEVLERIRGVDLDVVACDACEVLTTMGEMQFFAISDWKLALSDEISNL